jgi:ACT domain-containing protein
MTKQQNIIDARKAREQASLLENLRKLPIVQIACEKTGISRATYYRWRKEDEEFTKSTDEALQEGVTLVSDMAESQLLTQIRDGNLGAVMYWLKHRNQNYNNKLEVTARIKQDNEALTPEQEAAITEALKMASFTNEDAPSISSSQSTNESESQTPVQDAATPAPDAA